MILRRVLARLPRRDPLLLSVRLLAVLLLVPSLVVALVGCTVAAPSVKPAEVFAAAPWRAGERHEYRLRNSTGDEIGRGVLTTKQEGDRLVLEQVYTEAKTPAGAQPVRDQIALTVDAKTLRPLLGARETSSRDASGKAQTTRTSWTYRADGDRLRLATRVERAGARPDERELVVRSHAYDNEASLWLWRGIAFAEGYDQAYLSVNPFERRQQPVTLRVPQREQVEVPAGTFDAWRILLRNGRAVRTAWMRSSPPHQVVRWDNGEVIFELVRSE